MNEDMELAWHSGHRTGQDRARCFLPVQTLGGLTGSPAQDVGSSRAWVPPIACPPTPIVIPGTLSGLARGSPGGLGAGVAPHCSPDTDV